MVDVAKTSWNFPQQEATAVSGEIRVPGDKSVSHRAVMLGGIADGCTQIDGFLHGEDTLASAAIMRAMGVEIHAVNDTLCVQGLGLHGLRAPGAPLDCGNAGTGMRLLAGLLSGQAFDSTLIGDASLSKRPMQRIVAPLTEMGAHIHAENGFPPLQIQGGRSLQGIAYASPVASAQVKSAVLLAGLYAQGITRVDEPRPTRDYTERMLERMGAEIEYGPGYAQIKGGVPLQAVHITVPGDFSSAAFLIVLATLTPGSCLTIRHVGLNPTRTGLLHALSLMGANLSVENMHDRDGDRVGDITVRYAQLSGADIPAEWAADMIDEFPILFVAAAAADGVTTIRGAAELRVKESDRIEAMVSGLKTLGVSVEGTPDGAVIHGNGTYRAGAVDSFADHRIAMSFAVFAAATGLAVRINDVANVETSFPRFAELLQSLGRVFETRAV